MEDFMRTYSVSLKQWVKILSSVTAKYNVFAPLLRYEFLDYELISDNNVELISYNEAKPTTPLKAFFFPIKENVVKEQQNKKRVIFGVPSCDLSALNLLDKIFLDEDFLDTYYKENRENTILIGSDCYEIDNNCHCTSYGINPYPEKNCDISFSLIDHKVTLQVQTKKGEKFLSEFSNELIEVDNIPAEVEEKRQKIIEKLKLQNEDLPDAEETKKVIMKEGTVIWKKYAKDCVSCGACTVICPSCHCFLLIDKANFEKVKNWDACQYPAFERVAGDEDPLEKIYNRLKNRYLCKFVHKPDMFNEIACTGCGRCIDACIGKISKNELIIEACK
jgi:sulfhydrogenase subunit beta (sulfur reductase)